MKNTLFSFIHKGLSIAVLACSLCLAAAAETFTNPVIPPPSADPFVFQHDGYYYYIHTIRRGAPGVGISKSDDVTKIGQVPTRVVWLAPNRGPYSKEVWAPEIHFYRGKWYIYVACDDGRNENHRMWVIESEGSDPMGPYKQKPTMLDTEEWAIDGTVLENDGQLWFVWSGWPGKVDEVQNLYIAPMDSPTHISAKRTLLSEPTQDWEKQTRPFQEGPQILKHDGKIFIIYSASASWKPEYCQGMLEYLGGDMCDPKNWKKHTEKPIFAGEDNVLGVGHCSFFKSPDGKEDWIAYHTKSSKKDGWGDRCVHLQPFTFDDNGLPNFGKPVQPGIAIPVPSGTADNLKKTEVRDLHSDTWVATDNLGRSLPNNAEVGDPRQDKSIGMFYFLWMGAHGDRGPFDVSKILAKYPEARDNPDHPAWGRMYETHHWGESWFGYYLSTDEAIYEKHARMLGEMGVDVIIFDNSNKITYFDQYMALCRAFTRVRESGGRTPQIAFLCPFWDPATTVTKLWNEFYSKNLYPDLWYRWEGKPLILANPDACQSGLSYGGHGTPAEVTADTTLGQLFVVDKPFNYAAAATPTWSSSKSTATITLKKDGPDGEIIATRRGNVIDNGWFDITLEKDSPAGTYYLELSQPENKVGWWSENANKVPGGKAFAGGKEVPGSRNLRISYSDDAGETISNFFTFRAPQPDYFTGPTAPNQWSWLEVTPQHIYYTENGLAEQMCVGTAQNAVEGKLGVLSNPKSHGRSFHNGKQPIDVADQDTSGRNFQEQWNRALEVDPSFIFITGWNEWIMGRHSFRDPFHGAGPVAFVDQFNQEYSRDIEPAMAPHQDNFYYQTIANIRKYKGVRKADKVQSANIKIDGNFGDWAKVSPEFLDHQGDPIHRDWKGYGELPNYVNNTGRHDIVAAKMCLNGNDLKAYVRTWEPMYNPRAAHWMLLFLDTDANPNNGYAGMGYDYCVRTDPNNPNSKAIVQRYEKTTTALDLFEYGRWVTVGTIDRAFDGTQMELSIPLNMLGLQRSVLPYLDFKWTDNIQENDEVRDFTVNGDAAPDDRYNYRAYFR